MNELHQTQNRATVLRINCQMLGVVFWGLLGWYIWPTSWKWWGFGFLSIVSVLVSIALAIQCAKLIWQLYTRDKLLEAFRKKGRAQKASNLASRDALKNSGVRHD